MTQNDLFQRIADLHDKEYKLRMDIVEFLSNKDIVFYEPYKSVSLELDTVDTWHESDDVYCVSMGYAFLVGYDKRCEDLTSDDIDDAMADGFAVPLDELGLQDLHRLLGTWNRLNKED